MYVLPFSMHLFTAHLIRIAQCCVELQNFNTACAIMAGLQHSAVSRLKLSWEVRALTTGLAFALIRGAYRR